MGVPKFYRWLSERYPCLSEVISDTQIPEYDNLYLDMNGIIHNCSHPNDDDITFRISEEQIFQDIFSYIEKLYRIIRPQKVFFMAVDGVAPRAKMNQQRARRFMSARTAEEQLAKAKARNEEIPTEKRFDSNCITPGTSFMAKLHEELGKWVEEKVNSDPAWQGVRIYLSGHDCPGEGEHKIMDFIRSERISTNYDPNTRHCMYGLDADLIMLGLCSHEPHFSLLREEVKFTPPSRKKKKEAPKRVIPSEITFHLLHLSLLREYLAWEFKPLEEQLSFTFDMEKIVDDWILMGFLIGNDFIPHLPHIHIHDDALPILYETYREVLPQLDGYINEEGYLNLKRFELFVKAVAQNDRYHFMRIMEDSAYLQSKKTRSASGFEETLLEEEEELQAFEDSDMENDDSPDDNKTTPSSSGDDPAFISSDEEGEVYDKSTDSNDDCPIGSASELLALKDEDPMIDEITEALALAEFKDMDEKEFENRLENIWSRSIGNHFKRHKRNYYREKMRFSNIQKEELREQAEGYVRAIQWVLHYYYHGCVSWNWYFPHHYAPYISDVSDFTEMKMNFEMSEPFKPFEQLLAVLPEASGDCIPTPLRELMKTESPIADFYPTKFETDLNGKKNDWEAVVLIPFIDEKRLLKSISEKAHLLSPEERSRNSHGGHLLFYSGPIKENGKCSIKEVVHKNIFRIPKEQVVWGLLPNVRLDVYFPGFPTTKHIPHTAYLKKINVRVFQSNSTRPSMLLEPFERETFKKDYLEVAFDLIDKEVFVDWPILKMAKVFSVWGPDFKYQRQKFDEVTQIKLEPEEQNSLRRLINDIRDKQLHRFAINVEEVNAVAYVRRLLGVVYETHGEKVVPVKQWSSDSTLMPVLLPLLVSDIESSEGRKLKEMSVQEAYPPKSKVFVMEPSWKGFGFPTIIEEYTKGTEGTSRAIVTAALQDQPAIMHLRENRKQYSLAWYGSTETAKRSGVGSKLVARLTSFIPLFNGERVEVQRGHGFQEKLNIGLSLRSAKKNQEAPNYTRFFGGYWEYSFLCVRVLTEYKNKFGDLLSYLNKHCHDDAFYASDIWPNVQKREERWKALSEFLSNVVTKSVELKDSGSHYADNVMIAHLEENVKNTSSKLSWVKSSVNPSKLFRAELFDGKVRPDPNADFQILDRVVNTLSSSIVPFGLQGTIIGVLPEKLEVLFDKGFKGGFSRLSLESCAIVSKASVINITYGRERSSQGSSQNKKSENNDFKKRTPQENAWKNEKKNSPSKPYNRKDGNKSTDKVFSTLKVTGPIAVNMVKLMDNDHPTNSSNNKGKSEYSRNDEDQGTMKTTPRSNHRQRKGDGKDTKEKTSPDKNTQVATQELLSILGIGGKKQQETSKKENSPNSKRENMLDVLLNKDTSDIHKKKNREEPIAFKILKRQEDKPKEEPLALKLLKGEETAPKSITINEEKKEISVENNASEENINERQQFVYSMRQGENRPQRGNYHDNRRGHAHQHPHRGLRPQHPKLTDLKPSTISKPIKNKNPKTNWRQGPSTNARTSSPVHEDEKNECEKNTENTEDQTSSQPESSGPKKRTPRLAAKFGMA